MSDSSVTALDENARRYYLDMMGVQCWQLLEAEPAANVVELEAPAGNRDVAAASATTSTATAVTWSSLEDDVLQCQRCELHQTRTQVIAGSGSPSAELMIVLLSAGVGAEASALLSKMLAAINIAIDEVYITSLLKCDLPAQHTVSTVEIKACSDFLNQQIQLLQPKRLFVLGETAARCLFQKNIDLDGLREQVNVDDMARAGLVTPPASPLESSLESPLESPLISGTIPLLVSYSPQELLQQPENKRKSWSDLQQLQKLMKG